MSLDKINRFEKKYPVGIIGIGLTIIGLLIAFYLEGKVKRPQIVFDILSKTEVFSINEKVNDLKITFAGKDLRESSEKLILLTVRVSNEGEEEVMENDYYSKLPFGFEINNAKIVEEPQLIDASNTLLKEHTQVLQGDKNRILVGAIPLAPSQYLTAKVLLITSNPEEIEIKPIGAISGTTDEFILKESYKEIYEEEEAQRLTLKGVLATIGVSMIAGFFFVSFSSIVSSTIRKSREKKRRKKLKSFGVFGKTRFRRNEKVKSILFEEYIRNGRKNLEILLEILKDMQQKFSEEGSRENGSEVLGYILNDEHIHFPTKAGLLKRKRLLLELSNEGVIRGRSGETVDPDFIEDLKELLLFLQR